MKKQLIIAGAVMLATASMVCAQTNTTTTTTTTTDTDTGINQRMPFDHSTDGLYQPNELSLDLFGSDALSDYTVRNLSHAHLRSRTVGGAGVGLNYFPIRYIGVSVLTSSENTDKHFIDTVGGRLNARIPLILGLAPYVFGGGGRRFDPVVCNYGEAGLGVEWRFIHCFGIFADGSRVWTDRIGNYTLVRAGVKLAF